MLAAATAVPDAFVDEAEAADVAKVEDPVEVFEALASGLEASRAGVVAAVDVDAAPLTDVTAPVAVAVADADAETGVIEPAVIVMGISSCSISVTLVVSELTPGSLAPLPLAVVVQTAVIGPTEQKIPAELIGIERVSKPCTQ